MTSQSRPMNQYCDALRAPNCGTASQDTRNMRNDSEIPLITSPPVGPRTGMSAFSRRAPFSIASTTNRSQNPIAFELSPVVWTMPFEGFPCMLTEGRSLDEAQALYRRTNHCDLEGA